MVLIRSLKKHLCIWNDTKGEEGRRVSEQNWMRIASVLFCQSSGEHPTSLSQSNRNFCMRRGEREGTTTKRTVVNWRWTELESEWKSEWQNLVLALSPCFCCSLRIPQVAANIYPTSFTFIRINYRQGESGDRVIRWLYKRNCLRVLYFCVCYSVTKPEVFSDEFGLFLFLLRLLLLQLSVVWFACSES